MRKHNAQKARITIAATLTMGVFCVVGVGTATASHTHSLQTGNGSCVLLARNGGEKNVTLPHATGPDNRRHPLHVNVHLGEPGAGGHIEIGVAGTPSDPCYVAPAPIDP
jgi:hypothetical protein